MRCDGCMLAMVEMLANLCGSVYLMIEIGDEARDGAFEVDVVLPKRIVGIDKQCVAGVSTR